MKKSYKIIFLYSSTLFFSGCSTIGNVGTAKLKPISLDPAVAQSLEDPTKPFPTLNVGADGLLTRGAVDALALSVESKGYSQNSKNTLGALMICLLYTSPSPRDKRQSRMPSSA